jgi:type IV pilus assembly protein PilE
MSKPIAAPRRRHAGFTLIELMIAVAVVVILLAVALPNFFDSMRKSRRTEAFTALSALQQGQERYRSNHSTYASALADAGIGSATTSPGSYYSLSIATSPAPTATSYVATADGSGSSQANDGQCAKLSVKVENGDITYASCKSCTTFTYASSDACWKR